VLGGALELSRVYRWQHATVFRRSLWGAGVWQYGRNAIGLAIGGTVVGLWIHVLTPVSSAMRFRVEAVLPAADMAGAWGVSVACALARNLDRYPDLSARCVSGLGRWLRTGSRLGVATANDEGRL